MTQTNLFGGTHEAGHKGLDSDHRTHGSVSSAMVSGTVRAVCITSQIDDCPGCGCSPFYLVKNKYQPLTCTLCGKVMR